MYSTNCNVKPGVASQFEQIIERWSEAELILKRDLYVRMSRLHYDCFDLSLLSLYKSATQKVEAELLKRKEAYAS